MAIRYGIDLRDIAEKTSGKHLVSGCVLKGFKMPEKEFQSPFVTVLVKRTAFFVKHFVRLEKVLN